MREEIRPMKKDETSKSDRWLVAWEDEDTMPDFFDEIDTPLGRGTVVARISYRIGPDDIGFELISK